MQRMRRFFLSSILVNLFCCHLQADSATQEESITGGNGLPNVSAKPKNAGANWDLFGDALYWYASEQMSTSWASVITQENANLRRFTPKEVTFEGNGGFRIGLGCTMNYDQWDTQIYWTRYQTDAHSRIPDNGSVISPEFFSGFIVGLVNHDKVLSGKLKWKLLYNMIDWELGRNFQVSRHLAIRPFIALKGGFIDQAIHSRYRAQPIFGPTIVYGFHENLKNNFWGAGPCGGVNTQWEIAKFHSQSLSVMGDFSVAGLWGTWDVKDRYSDQRDIEMATRLKKSHLGAWTLRGLLGLSWAVNFNNDRSRFTTKLGYEMQIWFNQLKLPTFQQLILHGDLTFQGGTLECRFDF